MKIEYAIEAAFCVVGYVVFRLATFAAWLIAPVFSAWIGCRGARWRLAVSVTVMFLTAGVAGSQSISSALQRIDRLEKVVERQADNITAIQLAAAEHKYLETANKARLTSLEVQTAEVQRSVSEVRGGVTALQWLGFTAALILGILIKGHEIVEIFKKA